MRPSGSVTARTQNRPTGRLNDGPSSSPPGSNGTADASDGGSTPEGIGSPRHDEAIREAFDCTTEAYEAFVRDVGERERALGRKLPLGTATAGVADRLETPLEQWETGSKLTRVVPAVLAIEAEGNTVSPALLRVLVGLDVAITALDDLVDEGGLERADRFRLAVVATFGTLLSSTGDSPREGATVSDALVDYYLSMAHLSMAQTPVVERTVANELAAATTSWRELVCAIRAYAYRAEDVTAFVTIPGRVLEIEDEAAARLLSDLRAFRARQLLCDDLRDVETDLADGIETPIVYLLRTATDEAAVLERIAAILCAFPYSTTGADRYGDASPHWSNGRTTSLTSFPTGWR